MQVYLVDYTQRKYWKRVIRVLWLNIKNTTICQVFGCELGHPMWKKRLGPDDVGSRDCERCGCSEYKGKRWERHAGLLI